MGLFSLLYSERLEESLARDRHSLYVLNKLVNFDRRRREGGGGEEKEERRRREGQIVFSRMLELDGNSRLTQHTFNSKIIRKAALVL